MTNHKPQYKLRKTNGRNLLTQNLVWNLIPKVMKLNFKIKKREKEKRDNFQGDGGGPLLCPLGGETDRWIQVFF